MHTELVINQQSVQPGCQVVINLPLPRLTTQAEVAMPVHVIRGTKPGPRLFVCAAIHGDELNGIEIIRRLLKQSILNQLCGDLIAVPMVNVYGIIHNTRYLPDRRDLNRSFPGSKHGALAERLAELFMSEVVAKCTHGIDLHTGAVHRSNLPQIRADLDHPETLALAKSFHAPVLLNAGLRDGSLRQAATQTGIPLLLYEGGEALRFDETAILAGLRGILDVMQHLNMLPAQKIRESLSTEPFIAHSSRWIRASGSGIFSATRLLGEPVQRDDVLGTISDAFSNQEISVLASCSGLIIGRSELPLVHEGDAIFHVAQ
ncbi:hypothetical protein C8R34_1371 [Nitrosomonas sp. Nm84]|uniref:succinylglutamate desuccinylase/aspartoacylase family protein n=1 Tax=Nitrosomonas sp. Nm84 TaxID=200124 RepID=UPI000D7550EF|nr:succinylglutamate desuccinylase/aspartoacylase family protein [Nitrosomonas sp. Nm84]PXW81484.1 hypothetical protein C8R34_1371 [Nitrosomonas sp. Nm84]